MSPSALKNAHLSTVYTHRFQYSSLWHIHCFWSADGPNSQRILVTHQYKHSLRTAEVATTLGYFPYWSSRRCSS